MAEKKRFSLWLQKKNRPAGKSSEPSDAGEGGGEQVGSPMAGKLIDIEAVADPVFAQKILGDGVAILPTGGEVYSPVDGTVETLLESHHAVCLRSSNGAELLIHVGRDTVSLNGRYFTAHVTQGERVKRGQLLLSFDRKAMLAQRFDLTSPVVLTNGDQFILTKADGGTVRPGDPILSLVPRA